MIRVFSLVNLFCWVYLGLTTTGANDPFRLYDPVVLNGNDLYELIGADPPSIVGFRYDGNEEWTQIPIQIDEMHMQDWEIIKPGDCRIIGRQKQELVYSDPNTYSGPDEQTAFDFDDELVVMAKDLGSMRPAKSVAKPKYVLQDTMVEVAIADPLTDGTIYGFVYLFVSEKVETTGTYVLKQDADLLRINYDFYLTTKNDEGSNDYFDAYKFTCDDAKDIHEYKDEIMNPEDSWFVSNTYQRHFAENWYSDEMRITLNKTDGESFWGLEDFQFDLGSCDRSIRTFMKSPTGFVSNILGPLRAIRSWIGANSGAITQRQTIMYEDREDSTTFHRVHPTPGIFLYSNFRAGSKLKYYNCKNTNGFVIDGKMDDQEKEFDNGYCSWDMVTGTSGTYLRVWDPYFKLSGLDIPVEELVESWYYDDDTPTGTGDQGAPLFQNGWSMCSGLVNDQNMAWGTAGFKSKDVLPGIPNTDPLRLGDPELPPEACSTLISDSLSYLKVTAKQYYLAPDFGVEEAELLSLRALNPMYRKIRC